MSTDIGALQKQYDKLRRKQHHACVVISGIRPQKPETDVDVNANSQGSPTAAGSPDVDGHVEGSVAMLTLSVPIETEKRQQDLMDQVSPTVFGDAKCFFVQNVKKKKTKSPKRSNRSAKSVAPDPNGNITSDKTESIDSEDGIKTYQADTFGDHSDRIGKKVCFSEKVEILTGTVMKNPSKENDLKDKDVEVQNDTAVQKVELENDVLSKDNHHENSNEIANNENDVNANRKENGSCVSQNGLETDKSLDEADTTVAALGNENNEESINKEESEDHLPNDSIRDPQAVNAPVKLHSSILKNTQTHGLRNPAVNFSKQYYPSRPALYKKQRTNSAEAVESTNKQSIYQHFMMTKRQLSLDSTLSPECITAMSTKSIEFPFPVHSINENKIKAGMKLGLYDQKALEKFEKTRKLQKSKLPNLTYD